MNRRLTWWMLGLAVVLFAFIVLVERPSRRVVSPPEGPVRLLDLRASAVTNIQLRITNRLALRAEKVNDAWRLTVPILYPAQREKIEQLLQQLETLVSQKRLRIADLTREKHTLGEFGLEAPPLTLSLQQGGLRTELLFGYRTAPGDRVYVQLLAAPVIHEVTSELLDKLPKDPNEWRDNFLLPVGMLAVDRLEVRSQGRGFAIDLDADTGVFRLTRPTPARADRPKTEALMRTIAAGRVAQFVADGPLTDLESYGLQPPVAELAFGRGTNDVLVVQFGKSSTNDPALVFARRSGQNSVFLVAKTLLDAVLTPHTELRDRHLLTFTAPEVAALEVRGAERFEASRLTNGTWMVTANPAYPADKTLLRECLDRLSRLEGSVEKDVVADFAEYGLAQPRWSFLLKASGTNETGSATNRVLSQVDLGAQVEGKVYARRPDDTALYLLPVEALDGLPFHAWQLRDRRVFNFTTNQVLSVTIRQQGYERKLLRSGRGDWALAPGSQGIINVFAVEEMVLRLGELRAVVWVDRGTIDREYYGFADNGYKLTLEVKSGDKGEPVSVEFGKRSPMIAPFALTTLDGAQWVFEFPSALYIEMLQYLGNPPKTRPPSGQ